MFKWPLRFALALSLLFVCSRGEVLSASDKESRSLTHYIMALYYDGLGELDNAVKEYREVLKADSSNPVVHLNFAATLLKKKDIKKAKEELKLSAVLDPESVEPHILLAFLNMLQGDSSLAAKEYEIALKNASKIDPGNVDIYKSLGEFYLRQGDSRQAKDAFKLICELTPEDPTAHFYLGVAYGDLKEFELSEKSLRRAIELNPDYAQALNYLGYTFIDHNRNFREAERLIKRALKIEPNNGAYLDSLGWLYYKKGRLKEAKVLLEKAAEIYPDPVIFDHLGDLFFRMKDVNKALFNWGKSLKLKSPQDDVKKKIDSLNK